MALVAPQPIHTHNCTVHCLEGRGVGMQSHLDLLNF